MQPIERLLSVVDAYRDATGLAEATISTRFFGRGSRLAQLRDGGDMGARLVERVLAELSANWPPRAAWPDNIPRPTEASADAAE